jgi:hypothetical protein
MEPDFAVQLSAIAERPRTTTVASGARPALVAPTTHASAAGCAVDFSSSIKSSRQPIVRRSVR